MFEAMTIMGERGQITIPKHIRALGGLLPKDRVMVKFENERIVVEKISGRKVPKALLKEYYLKHAGEMKQMAEEFAHASKEADKTLDGP